MCVQSSFFSGQWSYKVNDKAREQGHGVKGERMEKRVISLSFRDFLFPFVSNFQLGASPLSVPLNKVSNTGKDAEQVGTILHTSLYQYLGLNLYFPEYFAIMLVVQVVPNLHCILSYTNCTHSALYLRVG